MNQQLQLISLAAEINTLHDSAQQAAMTAVQYAAKCGEKLIQAKNACAHGEWSLWLKDNCRLSQNQSAKYMKLFREMPNLLNSPSTVNFTGIEAAIAYLSASDDVKAEVDASTEPVTERLINDLKKQHSEALQQKAEVEQRAEGWRKQYLSERDAKRALEANPTTVEVEVMPPDYEATKQAAAKLAADLAKAEARAKLEQEQAQKLEAELLAIEERKKADITAGVSKALADYDQEIQLKQRALEDVKRREEEARQRYNRITEQISAAQMRTKCLTSAKDHLVALSADIYDAFDGVDSLTADEVREWRKIANALQDGVAVLNNVLGVKREAA